MTITPYLCVADARAAIAWYADALGAVVTHDAIVMDDGRVGHVELAVEGCGWMMSDAFAGIGIDPPAEGRGAAVTLHLATDDVDAIAARVVAAGTLMDRGPEDAPQGRVAVFRDPFGHRWMLNTSA